MDIFIKSISQSEVYLLVILIAVLGILIINFYNMIKIRTLSNKYNRFIKSFGSTDIEASLEEFMKRVEEVYNKSLDMENHCNKIDRSLMKCFQKIGVIRYNAFEDVGSDLSFAIALLDANDDGFIINGIYSRESSCTYAKPVSNGQSRYTLSAEELQALDIARKMPRKEN